MTTAAAPATRARTVVLGEVTTIVMGQSPPSETYTPLKTGLPFLQGKAEFGPVSPTPVKWCRAPIKRAPAGSVLVSVRAPVGDANVADREYCIGRGLAAVVAGPAIDPSYLFFLMVSCKAQLASFGTGSTFQSINGNVLRDLPIPLPSLDEQRRAARLLSTIQHAQGKNSSCIQATLALRRTVIDDAMGNNASTSTTLGALIERPQYGLTASATTGRGPRFLRITDITEAGVNWDKVPTCTPAPPSGDRYRLRDGDLVVARIGATTGKAWLARKLREAVFASYLIRVRVVDGTDPRFLSAFFDSRRYWLQIDAAKGGRLKGGVNIDNLNGLQLPLLSLERQREIGDALDAIDAYASSLRERNRALDDLFSAALTALMGRVE